MIWMILMALLVTSPILAIAVLWGIDIAESRKWRQHMDELQKGGR